MPKVYLETYAELWVSWTLSTDPEPMFTSWGVGLADATPWTQSTSQADAIAAPFLSGLPLLVPNTWTIDAVYVLFGNGTAPDDDQPATKVLCTTGAETGQNSSGTECNPPNTAYLIHKGVAAGHPGRAFVPGVLDNQVFSNGVLDSTFRADQQTILNGMFNDVGDIDGGGPVVFPAKMRKLPASFGPNEYALQEVTSYVLDGKVATQRRRLRP
jgi:hypothetical protein